jgi:hypothetical protein
MADSLKATFDSSEWDVIFAQLAGPVGESLARRMAVSGGVVLRDEAKLRAPLGTAEEHSMRPFGGSKRPGALKAAIYLAYSDASKPNEVTYHISWNSKKAPHGHLLEFGYWQKYKVIFSKEKGWFTTKELRPTPKWIPAWSFLRPAYEAKIKEVRAVMIQRGREELPKLLRGET